MATDTLTRPDDLNDLRGKPKAIYKLIKADLLTETELEKAHGIGFNDVLMDFEDDLHTQMMTACIASKKRIEEHDRESREKAIADRRGAAKEWLKLNSPGVDPERVSEKALDDIHASLLAAAEDDSVEILSSDTDELCLVTSSGEILGFVDAPRDDIDRRNILEWVGERITRSQASAAGLVSERDYWLNKINSQFNPSINKQTRIQTRLEYLYTPVGQAYLDELRAKNKSKKEINSVKIGLLTCSYSTTRASTTVEDESAAIIFCEKNFPDAVKTVKSILVSVIPDLAKPKLDRKATGLFFYPGGEKKFGLK